VKIHNGVPVLAEYEVDNGNHQDDDDKMKELINQAQIFNLEDTEDFATSNEGVSTSTVSVIAGEGVITITNAAGKKVSVSNILGQTVATQTISSDNVTISAPAGIVVVSVDGEEAVKAIVK
jgi:DNA-binding protein YbaB